MPRIRHPTRASSDTATRRDGSHTVCTARDGGGAGEGRWLGPLYEPQLLLDRLRDTAIDERLRNGVVAVEVRQPAAATPAAMDTGGEEVKDVAREAKRKREHDGDDGREEKEAAVKPAVAEAEPVKSDLFRQRRQNKIPKQH